MGVMLLVADLGGFTLNGSRTSRLGRMTLVNSLTAPVTLQFLNFLPTRAADLLLLLSSTFSLCRVSIVGSRGGS